MENCMVHWNGNQTCVIDVETSGTNPDIHEILQLAILPLDSNLKIRKDVIPFNIYLLPNRPELMDKTALSINKLSLDKLQKYGVSQHVVFDLFDDWFEKLNLPYTQFGNKKKIIPLGHNYAAFDLQFIKKFFGELLYEEYFTYFIKDSMILANGINDIEACKGNNVPYPRLSLSALAKQYNIDTDGAHDALVDCRITAEVYHSICFRGLPK